MTFTSSDLRDRVSLATDAIVEEIVTRHGVVPVADLEHRLTGAKATSVRPSSKGSP
ncbi:hypothetical protein [Spirillospora sp. CA-294931]|uniref:hypothetical protein n=1 Tax=Spirillospora sp. CA-294931 TaxID=3240042 RepID=UPI003D8DC896